MTSPQESQLKEQKQEIPHMTSPKYRQLREKNQGVKREHDIMFLHGEEHLHFEKDVCEDWMETISNPKHF
jgi:hypothetical protein